MYVENGLIMSPSQTAYSEASMVATIMTYLLQVSSAQQKKRSI